MRLQQSERAVVCCLLFGSHIGDLRPVCTNDLGEAFSAATEVGFPHGLSFDPHTELSFKFFYESDVALRASTVYHEARHADVGCDHVDCPPGGLNPHPEGACDSSWSPGCGSSGLGAYGFTVVYDAWFINAARSNYTNITIRDRVWNNVYAVLAASFVQDPCFRLAQDGTMIAFTSGPCGAITVPPVPPFDQGPQQFEVLPSGVHLVGDSEASLTCGGGHTAHASGTLPGPAYSRLAHSGAIPGTNYFLVDWRDALKLLYTGIDHNGVRNCGSSVRRALVANYANLFKNGCSSTTCSSTAHAFRMDDNSDATHRFLSAIGAPGITVGPTGVVTATPFCNGKDSEDNDPIRRSCDPTEQVCEADGTLGLVLPIVVPAATQDRALLYNASESAPFSKLKPALGTACPSLPPSITDPTGTRVSPCGGNVVYNLPAGCSFPNSLRCDCRFPLPEDFAIAVITGTTTPCPSVRHGIYCWPSHDDGTKQQDDATVALAKFLSERVAQLQWNGSAARDCHMGLPELPRRGP